MDLAQLEKDIEKGQARRDVLQPYCENPRLDVEDPALHEGGRSTPTEDTLKALVERAQRGEMTRAAESVLERGGFAGELALLAMGVGDEQRQVARKHLG